MENEIQGPAWDLSNEYTSTDAAELEADLNQVLSICAAIEGLNEQLSGAERVQTAQEIFKLRQKAAILLQGSTGTHALDALRVCESFACRRSRRGAQTV